MWVVKNEMKLIYFRCVVLLDCFWALGACAEVLLAAVILPSTFGATSSSGWRWLLALSALPPAAFAVAAAAWMPESPRFDAAKGDVRLNLINNLIDFLK